MLREGVKLDKQDLGFENQYRDLGLRQGGEEQDLWYGRRRVFARSVVDGKSSAITRPCSTTLMGTIAPRWILSRSRNDWLALLFRDTRYAATRSLYNR